jgi:hypothetical protein
MLHIEWESDVSSPNGMDVENVNKPVKYQQLPERTVVVGDALTAEKFSTPTILDISSYILGVR